MARLHIVSDGEGGYNLVDHTGDVKYKGIPSIHKAKAISSLLDDTEGVTGTEQKAAEYLVKADDE